jgi:hypothetical protein
MSIPEGRRLKQLEDENVRLERWVADQVLDNSSLRDLLKKYSWRWRTGARPSGTRSKEPASVNAGHPG